jgi:hypothetical protein
LTCAVFLARLPRLLDLGSAGSLLSEVVGEAEVSVEDAEEEQMSNDDIAVL